FNVTGQATDAGGGGASTVVEIHVVKVLAVSIAANWSRVDAGVPVGFVGTASGGTGTYASYAWDFGDGSRSPAASPSHAFAAPGNYSVRLTVTDSLGTNGSSSYAVAVDPALVATARFSPASPSVGEPVQFVGGTSNGTPPVSYHWEFGDRGSASAAAANHTFTSGGTYVVTLWANDSGGGAQSRTLSVTVQGGGGPGAGSVSLLWIAGGAGAVLLAAGALSVAFRSRRRRAPSSEGTSPDPAGDQIDFEEPSS
ncbi:MAG TPA: PKD domain-containing protein, partial [Thermoplasmata archaeon]|nr:PKD domain-containing protein [Thermoplasmata archaeon]